MMAEPLRAAQARPSEGGPSFTLGDRLFRAVWLASWTVLAAWTPPFMHGWRRLVIRVFGGRLAQTARVYGSVRIWNPRNLEMGEQASLGPRVDCYAMAPIRIGDGVNVSQGAVLCSGSHDIDDPDFQLVTAPIVIGPDAWIAAEAFVGPGVTVGEGAVLGARGVAFSNLEPWMVYIGSPARATRARRRRGSR